MYATLNEDIYQDLDDILTGFQLKLEPFILDKNLNNDVVITLQNIDATIEKLVKGRLYALRSNEH